MPSLCRFLVAPLVVLLIAIAGSAASASIRSGNNNNNNNNGDDLFGSGYSYDDSDVDGYDFGSDDQEDPNEDEDDFFRRMERYRERRKSISSISSGGYNNVNNEGYTFSRSGRPPFIPMSQQQRRRKQQQQQQQPQPQQRVSSNKTGLDDAGSGNDLPFRSESWGSGSGGSDDVVAGAVVIVIVVVSADDPNACATFRGLLLRDSIVGVGIGVAIRLAVALHVRVGVLDDDVLPRHGGFEQRGGNLNGKRKRKRNIKGIRQQGQGQNRPAQNPSQEKPTNQEFPRRKPARLFGIDRQGTQVPQGG
mmetsp:Transcript_20272/g.56364  ORF Transcript_20272/g.56364 Transcript_20272/m.56364 type:complete len:305 (-) Transcript_20272:1636-2550(-)